MTKAQKKWMTGHRDYQPITSWLGPYTETGVLFSDGKFELEPSSTGIRLGCRLVGRPHSPQENASD